ncbi:MAG TPA: cation transporter, partial [Candidatus Nitrosotalea sp.]|nr:cation transporter [Candidatus Nitrosotalea sp.]
MHTHREVETKKASQDGGLTEFAVTGMSCANCARHVTEAIQSVEGVAGATVELDNARATVRWAPEVAANVDRVVAAVKGAGYEATPVAPDDSDHRHSGDSPMAAWKFTLFFGAALTLPLLLGEWVFGLGVTEWFQWVGLAFSAPVMIVCGGRFFRGAWLQLRRGGSNMDTLVALGSTTAFGFSLWGLLTGWHGHLYFMEAAS